MTRLPFLLPVDKCHHDGDRALANGYDKLRIVCLSCGAWDYAQQVALSAKLIEEATAGFHSTKTAAEAHGGAGQ